MKYFLYVLKNTFNYKGRARRAEFGWFYLIGILIFLALSTILYALIFYHYAGVPIDLMEPQISITILSYVICGFAVWFFIATLSLITRRLHDIGKSGKWLLVGFYIPVFVFLTLGFSGLLNDIDSDSPSLVTTITFWFIPFYFCFIGIIHFWLLFKKGEPTKNQYGEVPKAEDREMYARLRAERAANQAATAPTQSQSAKQNLLNEKSSG